MSKEKKRNSCNGYNHDPDCNCGWGGVFYSNDYAKPIQQNIKSITVPNARCPVCRANVFYYENEYGSKVFFDHLGPPWPRHPCTTILKTGRILASTGKKVRNKTYIKNGWLPIFVRQVKLIEPGIVCINFKYVSGSFGFKYYEFYIDTDSTYFNKKLSTRFDTTLLAYIKFTNNKIFTVSCLNNKMQSQQFVVFSNIDNLKKSKNEREPI